MRIARGLKVHGIKLIKVLAGLQGSGQSVLRVYSTVIVGTVKHGKRHF